MNKLIIVLTGFISILFTTSAIAQVPTDQARNFQIDATHTGSVSSPGLTPPLKEKWVVNFGQPISYPLIADGRVFVTVKDPTANKTNLVALDATNGAILWSAPLGGGWHWSAACYENGRVFAINGSGLLRAFDSATGTVIWSVQFDSTLQSAPPTVFQGVVYVSIHLYVVAVSADTGAVLWTTSVINGDTSSPAVTSDGLWVSYACPTAHKLNPTSGTQVWIYLSGCSGGGGKTPALYNGRLYMRDVVQDWILDADTGTVLGNFNTKNNPAFLGSTGFFLDGPHVFGSFGTLRARDINTNAELWSFAGDGQLQSGVLVVNDFVYIGSASGKLYALNAATGRQAWVTTAGASIPFVAEGNTHQPTTSFAAAEGLLVIPTSTTLVAYEVDNTPPALTFGDQTPAANGAGWNNTPVDVPFTTAGVQYADPASPLHFTSEGANQTQDVTLTYRDGTTTVTSPVVNIDLTAPTTSANITGSGGEWSASVQVTLSSNDNLSGVANTFYKLDGGAAQTYTSAFSVSSNGTHTISYWSVDAAGNTESAHSSVVKVDSAAPTTQMSPTGIVGTNGWFRSAVQISLSASDNNQSGVAGTSYSVDGGPTQTYAGAFSIGNDGVHQVDFFSVDALGNTEAQQSMTVKIDMTIGTLQRSLSGVLGNLNYYTTPVQVTLTASDTPSGVANVYYRIDGGAMNIYTSPFTISTDGIHFVEYSMFDVAGNSIISSVDVRIDKTAPVTQVNFSGNNLGNNGWYRGAAQISMSATDNQSGVQITQYMIDNGSVKTYTAPFNYSSNGIHTITYWSIDKALNSETVRTVQLKIDERYHERDSVECCGEQHTGHCHSIGSRYRCDQWCRSVDCVLQRDR
jgi:outer membrane protein assembly factor BamB